MSSKKSFNIFLDTLPPSNILKLKQNEDFVPNEFVLKSNVEHFNDTLTINSLVRFQTFTGTQQIQGTLKERFQERQPTVGFAPFFLILISILLILIAKFLYWKSFKQWYESLLSFTKFRLWIRDTGSLMRRMFIFTTPAFLLIIALTVDFVIQKSYKEAYLFSIHRYLMTLLFIVIFFILRHLLMKLAAIIFKSDASTEEQIRNIQIHNTLLLFILCIVLPFSIYSNFSSMHWAILPIIILNEAIRMIKGFISAVTQNEYGIYYFFLYFCTVEILPALMFIKLGLILAARHLEN